MFVKSAFGTGRKRYQKDELSIFLPLEQEEDTTDEEDRATQYIPDENDGLVVNDLLVDVDASHWKDLPEVVRLSVGRSKECILKFRCYLYLQRFLRVFSMSIYLVRHNFSS